MNLSRKNFNGPGKQRGMIAIIIAIIVLVCTLLAVIGLMRSVDSSNLIAGAMSFKQGVLVEAERAFNTARSTVPYGTATEVSNVAAGYYATVQAADTARTDIPAALVAGTGGITLPAGATGNQVRFMLERLCRAGVTLANRNDCIVPGAYVTGGTNDESGSLISPTSAQAAYRLTVRVDGPRNARAYVQTIIR